MSNKNIYAINKNQRRLFESAKKSRQYANEYMSKLGYTKPTASISHLVDGNGKSYLISSDETHLTPISLFCSSKYVGEKEAEKCRNNNSNPRNNRLRKIDKINRKGVLFDIAPFVIERVKTKTAY